MFICLIHSINANISIISFNVENLFDTKNNPLKKDDTYIPLNQKGNALHIKNCNSIQVKKWRDDCLYLDWNNVAVNQKIRNIVKIISSQNSDIISLQEVENLEILKLIQSGLDEKKYRYVGLIEGQDDRGINLGIISKYPISNSKLHPIKFVGVSDAVQDDTRGILETVIKYQNNLLRIYSVHFPAGYHPTSMRKYAFNELEKLTKKHTDIVVALGDFNVNITEDKKENIYAKVSETWDIAHLVGCFECKGTSFYSRNKTWSFLDNIMVLKGRGAYFDYDSIEVIKHPIHIDEKGIPRSFNLTNGSGVSDHFPIVASVKFNMAERQGFEPWKPY